jgi:hypothetical protein
LTKEKKASMKYFEKNAKEATTLFDMKTKEIEKEVERSPWASVPGGAAAGLGYAFLKGKQKALPSVVGGVLAGQTADNISKYYMSKELKERKRKGKK